MADSIKLLTADRPPRELVVPRAALVINSAVFRDLLSLPTSSFDTNANSVELAETSADLKPFLSVLSGKGATELRDLSESGWEKLATLADKYDSETARSIVREQAMSLLLDKTSSPIHTFVLAAMAQGSNRLLQVTALKALDPAFKTELYYGEAEAWKTQLKQHAEKLLDDAYFWAPGCDEPSKKCWSDENQDDWDEAMKDAFSSFNPKAPFVEKVQEELNQPWMRSCPECRGVMEEEARRLEVEYLEGLPAFPVCNQVAST
ncbi:hypothetical protein JCM6882_000579 [Rhodosporidiobolus microsporus]